MRDAHLPEEVMSLLTTMVGSPEASLLRLVLKAKLCVDRASAQLLPGHLACLVAAHEEFKRIHVWMEQVPETWAVQVREKPVPAEPAVAAPEPPPPVATAKRNK